MPKLLEQFLSDLQSEEEIMEILTWLINNPIDSHYEMIQLLRKVLERG